MVVGDSTDMDTVGNSCHCATDRRHILHSKAMTREQKIWGERWLIRQDSNHAVSYLRVREGYRCSWHVHKAKYNLFVVLRGEFQLLIQEMDKVFTIDLNPGESFTIKPGQWHEFRGVTDAEVIEHMYVEYDEGDIQREIVGGRVE